MKSKQIWLIPGLILTLLVSAAGLSGAGILDNASQIVNLAASGTGTVVPLNTVARVTPDGGIIPLIPAVTSSWSSTKLCGNSNRTIRKSPTRFSSD